MSKTAKRKLVQRNYGVAVIERGRVVEWHYGSRLRTCPLCGQQYEEGEAVISRMCEACYRGNDAEG